METVTLTTGVDTRLVATMLLSAPIFVQDKEGTWFCMLCQKTGPMMGPYIEHEKDCLWLWAADVDKTFVKGTVEGEIGRQYAIVDQALEQVQDMTVDSAWIKVKMKMHEVLETNRELEKQVKGLMDRSNAVVHPFTKPGERQIGWLIEIPEEDAKVEADGNRWMYFGSYDDHTVGAVDKNEYAIRFARKEDAQALVAAGLTGDAGGEFVPGFWNRARVVEHLWLSPILE